VTLHDTAEVVEELGGIDGVELHEWPGARVCLELLVGADQAEAALEKEREGRESEEREQREVGGRRLEAATEAS
jgi:hypothetical protein